MERITSAAALSELLDEFGWFELANCLILSPPPGGAAAPKRVELVLRDEIPGSIHDDVRTFRVTRLTATGVREWSFRHEDFDGDFYHRPDHMVEIAELIETSAGFGFGLDVPTFVWIVADEFVYERLPDVTEPISPWALDSKVTVTAPRAEVPSPALWVKALAWDDVETAWRMYDGPPHPTERVPADYTGWFLGRPEPRFEHDYGIFMDRIGADGDGITVRLERRGVDDELWLSVCRCVADWFPDGDFNSGIRHFTGTEWLAHLAKGDGYKRSRGDGLD